VSLQDLFLATSQREVVILELKNLLDSLVIYIHKEVNLEEHIADS
jgi:hypothetical protein|tara:strand:+ start:1328 stop:1462 length:135 start_codon:yes stop_codon:yes gene_type:complete